MPRVGLSPAAVVDAAIELLDETGPQALTLAAVAARTGVATPSLYKHVASLGDLRRLVAVRLYGEVADRLGEAALGHSRDDAVRELMLAYRDYATRYPNRYAALPQQALPDPELTAAADRVVQVIFAVLRGYGLSGSAAVHATRCIRAAAHGFCTLEIAGGFQLAESPDETYAHLISAVTRGLTGELSEKTRTTHR